MLVKKGSGSCCDYLWTLAGWIRMCCEIGGGGDLVAQTCRPWGLLLQFYFRPCRGERVVRVKGRERVGANGAGGQLCKRRGDKGQPGTPSGRWRWDMSLISALQATDASSIIIACIWSEAWHMVSLPWTTDYM